MMRLFILQARIMKEYLVENINGDLNNMSKRLKINENIVHDH